MAHKIIKGPSICDEEKVHHSAIRRGGDLDPPNGKLHLGQHVCHVCKHKNCQQESLDQTFFTTFNPLLLFDYKYMFLKHVLKTSDFRTRHHNMCKTFKRNTRVVAWCKTTSVQNEIEQHE